MWFKLPLLVLVGALLAASCSAAPVPGTVGTSTESPVSGESLRGAVAEAYVVALAEVCGSNCSSASTDVLVQLTGDAQMARGAVMELSDRIDILPPGADLLQLFANGDQPPIYVIGTARSAGDDFIVIPVETNLVGDGAVNYRADDIVLRLDGERWTVIADPSEVGVTVTTSVS